MAKSEEILIGNRGRDYVSILPGHYSAEDWLGADVQISCGGWRGSFNASFMRGELERLARDLLALEKDLSGHVEFKPLESYLWLSFSGNGKGHIEVEGKAFSKHSVDTHLRFAFEIDQTYLKGIIDALLTVGLEGKALR